MFAVIYLPDFALQAVLRPEPELHSRPVALLDDELPKATILQLTGAARSVGVSEGMTSTQALARCRDLVFKSRSARQEATATEVLLQCAYSFSPAIESSAAGICTLSLRGLKDSGDERFGDKIIRLLAQFELRAQVGVAENPGLALHAARCARPFLAVRNSPAFLAALPIESVEPSAEVLSILHKWGIRTLGEFTSLRKDRIAERLGGEGLKLFERASAQAMRPLNLVNLPELFEEAIDFENEVESLEPLLFILRRFVDQISRRLALAHFVAEEIKLRLRLSSGEDLERVFKVPAPTREASTLFRMLHTHLENVRTDHPITALYLSAKPGRVVNHQCGLFEVALRDPNQFFETMARLVALLGAERVGRPVLEETHRPDAFRMQPMDCTNRPSHGALCTPSSALRTPQGLALRRFRPPLHALVEMQEGRPTSVRTAKFNAQIDKAEGPWRRSGNWWDNQLWQRDEWDVHTRRGELYRLYQEREDWFVEGIYD